MGSKLAWITDLSKVPAGASFQTKDGTVYVKGPNGQTRRISEKLGRRKRQHIERLRKEYENTTSSPTPGERSTPN